MYKKCNSYKEQIDCIDSLINKCESITLTLTKQHPKDARLVAMNAVKGIAKATKQKLTLLSKITDGSNQEKTNAWASIGFQPSPNQQEAEDVCYYFSQATKLGFIVLSQFQIENCITNICPAIGVSPNREGFSNAVTAIRVGGHITMDQDNQFNIPARIRNSLHNGGMHNKADFGPFNIGNAQYFFQQNKKVDCATFEHIANALENSVTLLEKLFALPSVSATKHIDDAYANTKP